MFKIISQLIILIIFFCTQSLYTYAKNIDSDKVYKIAVPFFYNLPNSNDNNISDTLIKNFFLELKKYNQFIVIDNKTISNTLSELNLSKNDLINPENIKLIGDKLFIDFIITGTIISKNNLNLRFIETQSTKIVFSESIDISKNLNEQIKIFISKIIELLNQEQINKTIIFKNEGSTELRIDTKPSNANIVLNNEFVGRSPITLKGVKRDKYYINAYITEPITYVEAIITSKPSGVLVQKDNDTLGTTPITLKNIGLEPIYLNFSSNTKATIQIQINSKPPNVPVSIDGVVLAKTPTIISDIPLGTHELAVLEKKIIDINHIFTVDKEFYNLNLALFDIGKLILNTSINEAEIYIDNIFAGYSPNTLSIYKGEHNLTVKKENYSEYSEKIYINKGDIIEKFINLKELRAYNSSLTLTPTAELAENFNINTNILGLSQIHGEEVNNILGYNLDNSNIVILGSEFLYTLPLNLKFNDIITPKIGVGGFYNLISIGNTHLHNIYGLGSKLQILKENPAIPLSLALGIYWYKDILNENNFNLFASISRRFYDFSVHLGLSPKNLSLKLDYIRLNNFLIGVGFVLDRNFLVPSPLNITPLLGINIGYNF